MSYLDTIEQEMVLGDLKLFREFDSSNFVSNAKLAINGKIEAVTMGSKINHYGNMLEKAISNYNNIKIDKEAIKAFFDKFNQISRLDSSYRTIRDISYSDVISFKPQYLNQYVEIVGNIIDQTVNGTVSKDMIDQVVMGDNITKVERQIVKSTLNPCYTAKDLIKVDSAKFVRLDTQYIKTKLLPFVMKYDLTKASTIAEANAVLNAVRETETTMNAMIDAINKIKTNENTTKEVAQKLSYVSYNAIRGLLSIVSYVTYMVIRKLNIMSSNIMASNEAYVDIMNLYADGVMEAVDSVIPSDANSLAEDMIKGNTDAYSVLAKNIYDFHAGIPGVGMIDSNTSSLGDSMHSVVDMSVDNAGYNKYPYDEANKMYIIISQGLDLIARASDEYLLVFDDIINKSGFTLRLEDRFRGVLSCLDDLSAYKNVDNGTIDKSMYIRILSEIHDFSNNIDIIARNILDTKTKMDVLADRFEKNINGEFKDAEAVNELKIFMKDLDEQYTTLTKIVADKFMSRLKEMGSTLTEMESNSQPEVSADNTIPDADVDHTDYSKIAFESDVEDYEEETRIAFNTMEKEYFVERERSLKGINVIFEADDPNTNTSTDTPPTNNQQAQSGDKKPSTTPKVIDNSNTENTTDSSKQSITSKLSAMITKIIENFTSFISKNKQKNDKWIQENKNELLNRSYNNVTVQILPYSNVTSDSILKDIKSLETNIKSMTAQNMGSIQNQKALATKLFPFIKGGVDDTNLNVQVSTYYKTGSSTGKLEVTPISNGELKTQISTVIIPYCENYYGQFSDSLKQELDNVAKSGDEIIATYTSSGQKEGETSLSDKGKWMSSLIKTYSVAVLAATRDRVYDYTKILSSLVPKTPSTPAKPVQQNDQPTDQGNTQQ